jgi:hypothetical protein
VTAAALTAAQAHALRVAAAERDFVRAGTNHVRGSRGVCAIDVPASAIRALIERGLATHRYDSDGGFGATLTADGRALARELPRYDAGGDTYAHDAGKPLTSRMREALAHVARKGYAVVEPSGDVTPALARALESRGLVAWVRGGARSSSRVWMTDAGHRALDAAEHEAK